MDQPARRVFLRNAAGAAALSLTSQLSAFGRKHRLKIDAALAAPPGANLPDRLPPDWYRRKVQQVQQEMATRKLDALVLLRSVNVIYTTVISISRRSGRWLH
jgi:hypothetical protein